MKHSGVIGIVFILGCATGGVAAQLVIPPARAGTGPMRWEYQCLSLATGGGGVTSTLNKLGVEGWELASVAPTHQSGTFGKDYAIDAFMLCMKRTLP